MKKFPVLFPTFFLLTLFLSACSTSPTQPNNQTNNLTTPASPIASTPTAIALSPTPNPPSPVASPTVLQATPTPVPPSPSVSNALQPTQPPSGVGGTTYTYNKVAESAYGEAELKYYLYQPEGATLPAQLPLIALYHGYGNLNPTLYRPWIDHLVKRGNIVVFPVYQASATERGTKFAESGITALKNAITELQNGKHIRPDLTKFSLIGYSAGGVLSITIASQAAERGLPLPKAVMLVAPGGCASQCGFIYVQDFPIATVEQLAKLDRETYLLITAGTQDNVVFDYGAKYIWQNVSQIPRDRRDFVTFQSDSHGQPPLRADHGIPTRRVPDAFMFKLWQMFDGLQGCAFGQKEVCRYALGNTPEQRSPGNWSDGTPLKELLVAI
jgi:poly(3-hydroxybutyrate) depolymerase